MMNNSIGEEQGHAIKVFVAEGQGRIEICRRCRIHYQDNAMKKLTLYFWVVEIRAEGMVLSSHGFSGPRLPVHCTIKTSILYLMRVSDHLDLLDTKRVQ
jgi:hypothetical protein